MTFRSSLRGPSALHHFRRPTFGLVLALAAGWSLEAAAQSVAPASEAVHDLPDVVVTAARREQRLQDTPITTELVTARDIAVTGASDLGSVLVEQTGIELQGGMPTGAGVMLQGIGS